MKVVVELGYPKKDSKSSAHAHTIAELSGCAIKSTKFFIYMLLNSYVCVVVVSGLWLSDFIELS